MKFYLGYSLVTVGFLFLAACTEKEFTKDPAESFKVAKEPYDDKQYEIAVEKLGEFKARFPYSQYAIEAELLIGNSYYELGEFEQAAVQYAQFAKLHPKHAQVDFALFRVGSSYWALSPEEVNRDQEFTNRAVSEWERLITKMPDSPYSKEAEKLVMQGKRRIADSLDFVANFYCKQEIFHACAFKYTKLVERYPEFKDLRIKALLRAASALEIVAEQKRADPENDKNIFVNTMTADEIKALANKLRKAAQS